MLQFSRKCFNVDKYAYTVCYSWFKQNKHESEGVFEIFYRKTPTDYLPCVINSGVHLLIDYFIDFNFSDNDIQYIEETLNIKDKQFTEFLRNFSIKEIEFISCKEGSFIFPREPILTLKGKIGYMILIEAPVLALLHLSISASTQAFLLSYYSNLPISEMGIRRAYGPEAAHITSYFAMLNGFKSTSNVLINYQHGFDIKGTMSHAYILSYEQFIQNNNENENNKFICIQQDILDKIKLTQKQFEKEIKDRIQKFGFQNTQYSELMSFLNFFLCFNNNFVALIDTYNVYNSGIKNFLIIASIIEDYFDIQYYGIRLDSGDLIQQSLDLRKIAQQFDTNYNYKISQKMQIIATNDIGIEFLQQLKNTQHSLDALGIGTQLSTYRQIKPIGLVYKLVEIEKKGLLKQTGNIEKATLPYEKRSYKICSKNKQYRLITVKDEKIQEGENMVYKIKDDGKEFIPIQIDIDKIELINDQIVKTTEIDYKQYQDIIQNNMKLLEKDKNIIEGLLYGQELVKRQKEIVNKLENKQLFFRNYIILYFFSQIEVSQIFHKK